VITIHFDMPKRLSRRVAKRKLNNTIKAAMMAIGKRQRDQNFPKHFRVSGIAMYHMGERSRSYTKRKLREKHHRKPLVWTGRTRAIARRANVRAAISKGQYPWVKVPIKSRALTSRLARSRVHLAEDMIAMTSGELREHIRKAQRFLRTFKF